MLKKFSSPNPIQQTLLMYVLLPLPIHLGVNLYIYEEIGTQAVIIQQPCAFQTTQKGIFLH